jgi:hypothetical protein
VGLSLCAVVGWLFLSVCCVLEGCVLVGLVFGTKERRSSPLAKVGMVSVTEVSIRRR